MNYPHQPWGPQNQQPPYQQPHQQGYGPQGYSGWGAGAAQQQVEGGAERLAFLRKVYALFASSVLVSAIGAIVAFNVGGTVNYHGLQVPMVVAAVAGSPWIALFAMIGTVVAASAVRRKPGINVVALFGMAFVLGILFAPSLFIAQISAASGGTLSSNPIRDAFILAVVMFGGLTGYVTVSKKDFSYIGGFLSMGLFIVIGAAVLNMFVGSSALSLAIASVGLILFGGYVLYDTSRILRSQDRDAVGGAMTLYLDFLNIFLFLLRILGSRR